MPMKDIDYFAQFLDDLSSPFVGGTVTWNGGANAKIDEDSVTLLDTMLGLLDILSIDNAYAL